MAINPIGGGCGTDGPYIDEAYEFFAPSFFDFLNDETEEEIQRAERWFETSLSCNPSPFMPRIKVGRSVQMDSICDFGNVGQTQKEPEPSESSNERNDPMSAKIENVHDLATMEVNACHLQESKDEKISFEFNSEVKPCNDSSLPRVETSCSLSVDISTSVVPLCALNKETSSFTFPVLAFTDNLATIAEACIPKARMVSFQEAAAPSKNQIPKRIAIKGTKLNSKNRFPGSTAMNNTMATDTAQENQSIKRQKLDVGRARQILDVKTRVLPHKSKQGLIGGTSLFTSTVKNYKDDTTSVIQRRPKLTLTRPKGPELETAHRVRAVRMKSSAEQEEEMLAKMPKFKARPVNKKILDALPALPRSAPQPPKFQEFHLKTMERASQSSVSSTKHSSSQNQGKSLKLADSRPPNLGTALRARPPRMKNSWELELEELEKIPKFKARPFNKKILESKGDLGVFSSSKPKLTTPQEFSFATNQRMGPSAAVTELFDKLSLHSETHQGQNEVPRITIPSPFHLHTEERGIKKEKQFAGQLLQRHLEEERARIPKSNPCPYTTDYPVVPPKVEPKQCTKSEAFQLECLVRHEEEMQKKLEVEQRIHKEEEQRRIYKAQPIMRAGPLPLPEGARKPLTEVQESVLHVDQRILLTSKFNKKIKEKEIMYKRLREEYGSSKMVSFSTNKQGLLSDECYQRSRKIRK